MVTDYTGDTGYTDRRDEFLDGGVEGRIGRVVAESIDVGDAFECFHGVLLLMGTKKPANLHGRAGARWSRDGSVRGGQGGCCVGINDVVRGASGFILCDTDNCELDH